MDPSPIVVKVGGSLYDLDHLGDRLHRWLEALPARHVILIPGGGPTVEAIRALDRRHALGEEKSHWLALRALTVNAWFLASVLPSATVAESVQDCSALGRQGRVAVLAVHAFARADEGQPGSLPHSWAVTSDSLAARVAVVAGARQLVLLKSTTVPPGIDWPEAARRGFVDRLFAQVLATANAVAVEAVNFREWCNGG